MLVLVIGDLHVPARSPGLPTKFRKLLVPGKIGQILCTGNLTDRDTYDLLKGVAPDVHVVKGDYDENPNLPVSKVIVNGGLRVGLTSAVTVVPHDADALSIAARQMNVDVLVYGGTGRLECFESDGRFFVCPGSATGAMSTFAPPEGGEEEGHASFVLMDIQGTALVLYVYTLIDDEVKVEKLQYRKQHD